MARPKYTQAELLAQCDFTKPFDAETEEWLNMPDVGRERLDSEPQSQMDEILDSQNQMNAKLDGMIAKLDAINAKLDKLRDHG